MSSPDTNPRDWGELKSAYKRYMEGDQPREWVPDPETDYRDGEKCSVCGASDIARFDDDDENSYCTACAVESREEVQAMLLTAWPSLIAEITALKSQRDEMAEALAALYGDANRLSDCLAEFGDDAHKYCGECADNLDSTLRRARSSLNKTEKTYG